MPFPAFCRHFGLCGGCSLQDKSYDAQLALKADKVRGCLASFIKEGPALEVVGSPETRFYRNKMEFSFGDVYPPVEGGPTVKLGLKPKGRWYQILDLQECHLLSPETAPLLGAVRSWAEANRVPPYNNRRNVGLLRHLVLREAKNGPERMVLLVTAPGDVPERSFLEAVLSVYPATTVLRGINGKLSDTAVSDRLHVLTGPGHITESLRFPDGKRVSLRVSPHSFFQTNTRAAERLYGLLRDWVREAGAGTVLDLYSGGGGITLSIADACAKAVGVETNPAAVADASANAALNGIANAEFYAGQVEVLLPSLLALARELLIVDPPRAGLHKSAAELLAAQGPRTIIYVSCNPESLGRDLAVLAAGYAPERVRVFDLFPHTDHVETVVMLRRR